jgi:hypothetical protein
MTPDQVWGALALAFASSGVVAVAVVWRAGEPGANPARTCDECGSALNCTVNSKRQRIYRCAQGHTWIERRWLALSKLTRLNPTKRHSFAEEPKP